MNTLAPNVFVKDIDATIRFYEQLGFKIVARVPEEGECVWAMMVWDGVTFMFQTFDSLGTELPQISRQQGGSLLFYISISGIGEFFERMQGAGTILKGLEKTFYGATEFSMLDNNGYVLTFAEHDQAPVTGDALN